MAAYANGNANTAGMLQMLAAVRAHTSAPVIIGGALSYAYDSASLVALDATLKKNGDTNIIWNFHPYMGPAQAGRGEDGCASGFERHIQTVVNGTERPSIITEFGQACCATDGACESCPSTYGGAKMGYDEAILTIAAKYGVSWLPWAWRPPASNSSGAKCEDLNGGAKPTGLSLAGSNGGKGGDFAALWAKFAGVAPAPAPPGPTPPAPPSPPGPSPGCPGGSLHACDELCPATPPIVYRDCVEQCLARCPAPGPAPTPPPSPTPTPPPPTPTPTPTPTPPAPTPSPPGACPGGNITACGALCPAAPPIVRQDCLNECHKRCPPSPHGPPSPPPPAPPPAPAPAPAPTPAPSPSPHGSCSKVFAQCGGKNWHGATCCDAGCSCTVHGPYYSQCTPPAGKSTCQ